MKVTQLSARIDTQVLPEDLPSRPNASRASACRPSRYSATISWPIAAQATDQQSVLTASSQRTASAASKQRS